MKLKTHSEDQDSKLNLPPPELPLLRLSEDHVLRLKSLSKEVSEKRPSEGPELKLTWLLNELPSEDQDLRNKQRLPFNCKNKH